jgi:hypothetical protein
LETITHPEVGFLEVQLEPVIFQAELGGFATSFEAVGQQMYIFQEQELIEEIKLTSLSLGAMGEAVFVLELFLSPQLFK